MENVIRTILLEQLINEGRLEDAKARYPLIPQIYVDRISQKDPSGNNKYLMWMIKHLWEDEYIDDYDDENDFQGWKSYIEWKMNNNITKETTLTNIRNVYQEYIWIFEHTIDIVTEYINLYHRHNRRFSKRDINQYRTFNELKEEGDKFKDEIEAQTLEKGKDYEKIYEDREWLLLNPLTHKASCIYGSHTQWCVTTRDNDVHFEEYTEGKGNLLFVIKKQENKKWALHLTALPKETVTTSKKKEFVFDTPWHKNIYSEQYPPVEMSNTDIKVSLMDEHPAIQNWFEEEGIGNDYQSTEIFDARDISISWKRFIDQSNPPQNIKEILEKYYLGKEVLSDRIKIKINKVRKKRNEVAYEVNRTPISLNVGDRVKLLASGYGFYKGDIGRVVRVLKSPMYLTKGERPQRRRVPFGREVALGNGGMYHVSVDGRVSYSSETPEVVYCGEYLQKLN